MLPIHKMLARVPNNVCVHKVSRRAFLMQTGVAGGCLVLGVACGDDDDVPEAVGSGPDGGMEGGPDGGMEGGPDSGPGDDPGSPGPASQATYTSIDMWVSVGDDGSVQLVVPRSEMGQGARTSCAMLLAEELGCDWEDVRVMQADADEKYGDQNTDSSSTVRVFWEPLRVAGASAREMLIAAAAAQLSVDASELKAEHSSVVHAASGDALSFAELAEAAAEQAVPSAPPLKDASDYAIIGKARHQGVDNCDIAMGKAIYGADMVLDGMLYASIDRSPTVKGSVVTYDGEAARAVTGVTDVVEIEADAMFRLYNNGIAVVAENTWAALQGRRALSAQWDPGPDMEQTAEHRETLRQTVDSEGTVSLSAGDFDAALAAADRVFEAHYESPYVVHAPMEPLVAVADVRDGGAEIWAPTQDPQRLRADAAMQLGIEPTDVRVHVTLLGGGFGRKAQPDFALEAVAISKQVGAPVKLQWTREDEVRHGFYRPENCQRLRATFDASNAITGLGGHTAFSSLVKVFAPAGTMPLALELDQGWSNLPFRFDNLKLEHTGVSSGLRIGWWRAVCNTFHAFSVCSFLDELAQETGQDGVGIYRTLLGDARQLSFSPAPAPDYTYDTGRLSGVIEAVADMGLWGTTVPEGEGVGFAAHMSFQSYVACALHVAVDGDKKITLKAADYAVDCGRAVHPDGIEAQVEGGMVYGLTAALFSELTVKDGAVEQSNFDTYPMLRLSHMPEVNVRIVESDAPPTGIGEPPTPPIAPALANAIFAATGERVRSLPLSAQGYSV